MQTETASESEGSLPNITIARRVPAEIIEDSSDDDLPPLPGTSAHISRGTESPSKPNTFKDSLEELNKKRRLSDKKSRSKEKHARKIVASPSPSPEPVAVIASRPAAPSASRSSATSSHVRTRAISPTGRRPKKSMPMFRAASEDSDAEVQANPSADTGAIESVAYTKPRRQPGEGKKSLQRKRKASPTSSSSSSSSESSAPPTDEDISEVDEDITLDFNPIVKDKLRPTDNSKAHRLDKLKQARAAKECESIRS